MSSRRETLILFGVSLILVGAGVSLLLLAWLSYLNVVDEHQKIMAFEEKWNLATSGDFKDWPKDLPRSFSHCVTSLFGLWDFYSDLQIGQGSCLRWSLIDETTFIHLGLPLGVLFIALGIVVNPYVQIWKEDEENNVEVDGV